MEKPYEKYVIREPVIGGGVPPAYHRDPNLIAHLWLGGYNVPETSMKLTVVPLTKIPDKNPVCVIHSHEVEQFVLYLGEPDSFEVLYNLVPPDEKLENDLMTYRHQYTITRSGGFYVPAGLRHNVFFVRIDKPILEITLMPQAFYDKGPPAL
jgi:hypothetical protein